MAKPDKSNIEHFRTRSAGWLLAFGCIITSAGFAVPPLGEVSETVLLVFGQCLFYAGAVLGIDVVVKRQIKKHLKEDEKDTDTDR